MLLRDDISPASWTGIILIPNFYSPSKKSLIETLLITSRDITYRTFFFHRINIIKIKMTNRQNKESPVSLSPKGQDTQHASVKWLTEIKLAYQNLHEEFSTGGRPGCIGVRSVIDIAVWCVPWVMTSYPWYVFLESLIEVKQRPRHDHVIVD